MGTFMQRSFDFFRPFSGKDHVTYQSIGRAKTAADFNSAHYISLGKSSAVFPLQHAEKGLNFLKI
jgi:hypothetical protein